jgi:hypothetical protein
MSEPSLPFAMRKPRNAKRGWFYINPRSIDVVHGQVGAIVTLTRRQLVAAVKVMDAADGEVNE